MEFQQWVTQSCTEEGVPIGTPTYLGMFKLYYPFELRYTVVDNSVYRFRERCLDCYQKFITDSLKHFV